MENWWSASSPEASIADEAASMPDLDMLEDDRPSTAPRIHLQIQCTCTHIYNLKYITYTAYLTQWKHYFQSTISAPTKSIKDMKYSTEQNNPITLIFITSLSSITITITSTINSKWHQKFHPKDSVTIFKYPIKIKSKLLSELYV